jgi:hypothetical protein
VIKHALAALAALTVVGCKTTDLNESAVKDSSHDFTASDGKSHYNVRLFNLDGDVCWVRCQYEFMDDNFKPISDSCQAARLPRSAAQPDGRSFETVIGGVDQALRQSSYALDDSMRQDLERAIRDGVDAQNTTAADLGPDLRSGKPVELNQMESLVLSIYEAIDAGFSPAAGTAGADTCLAAAKSGRGVIVNRRTVDTQPVDPAVIRDHRLNAFKTAEANATVPANYPEPRFDAADGKRYVVIFSYEDAIATPAKTHSFVTFFTAADGAARASSQTTISWLPAKMHTPGTPLKSNAIEFLQPMPEQGDNFSLDETLGIGRSDQAQKMLRWGPYEVSEDFYRRGLATAQHLKFMAGQKAADQSSFLLHYILHPFSVGSADKAHVDQLAAIERLTTMQSADKPFYSSMFENYLDHLSELVKVASGDKAAVNCVGAAGMVVGNFDTSEFGWIAGHDLLKLYVGENGALPGFAYDHADNGAYSALEGLVPALKAATIPEARIAGLGRYTSL